MTTSFLSHSVKKAILHLYEDLATPVSLKCSKLLEAGEFDQLATVRVDPRHYLDSESYWRDATAAGILRKLVELPTTFDRKAVAESSFLSCEQMCFRTNLRLNPYLAPGLPDTVEGVHAYIMRARKIISGILGPCPDSNKVSGRFGPGATYGDRNPLTTVPDKMSSEPTLTPDAWPYLFGWCGTLWAKACGNLGKAPQYVSGNRFTTVPKDCEKDRGIAVEPSINLYYQLAYGSVIRDRLSDAGLRIVERRKGIDLAQGQDIHRRVAREASIRGDLCTLDLSNASDTICSNLVKLLLPPTWFQVLNDLRSKKTLFKGKWHVLEKFSSMGNGFTFELETLVFLGLICACATDDQKLSPGDNVHVFGDDLIFPTQCSSDVMSALSFFGLTVNKRKSFVDGPFRESCGGDFFAGEAVRPHFLKEDPCEPQQLISLANGLLRSTDGKESRIKCIRRAWFCVLDAIPRDIRSLRGPKDLGDLCIHDTESRWRTRWRSSIRFVQVYRPATYRKVSWEHFKPDVILAAAVYGVPWGNGEIIPRDSVAGYKIGSVPFS